MGEIITSRTNKTIIETAKLKDKKHRDEKGLFCFEGRKLFDEAVNSNIKFEGVFVTENYTDSHIIPLDRVNAPIYTVTNTVYQKLSDDRAPDGIFCVAQKKNRDSEIKGVCFILCSVRDPGNLGTCIRSARAFGIDSLILYDCADEYNPKVIRASMGTCFRQNIIHTVDINETISNLFAQNYRVFPSALSEKSIPLESVYTDQKTVFIVGNEGHGVPDKVIEACGNTSVIIPMRGDTESLNASVAASLLMWEISKTL